MAEFCKQCSIELFGRDESDMVGQITPEQAREGLIATGICEGCGGGEFDHDGTCLGDCLEPMHNVNAEKYENRLSPEAFAEYNRRMDDLS